MPKRYNEDNDNDKSTPFAGLQKNLVLQDSKIFHKQINPDKCVEVLTKILYLLYRDEVFSKDEVTDLFFACTKLFQSNNVYLRRMVYLVLKELSVDADKALILVSCLSKDMTSNVSLYRSNAIRVLCKILDASMLNNIERFLKQSIVDNNYSIVQATLIGGHHLFSHSPEVVRRWASEINELCTHHNPMIQYLASSLQYRLRIRDKVALRKLLITQCTNTRNNTSNNMLLHVYNLRQMSTYMRITKEQPSEMLSYIVHCLVSSKLAVRLEACKTIIHMDNPSTNALSSTMMCLHDLLNESTVHKFAALRLLTVAIDKYPNIATNMSSSLEALLHHPNRSLATFAVTVLLKSGGETSVEKTLKSLLVFISEVNDEHRITLVKSIQHLGVRFPAKHSVLISFLLTILREEGSLVLKATIVHCIYYFIEIAPENRVTCLEALTEYIEDCEHPMLSVSIISKIAEKAKELLSSHSDKRGLSNTRFIRYIYNRTTLESAPVRAAAVSALYKFGLASPTLRKSIAYLIRYAMNDVDDEVRERAIYYYNLLQILDTADIRTKNKVLECSSNVENNVIDLNNTFLPNKVPALGPNTHINTAAIHSHMKDALLEAELPPVIYPDLESFEYSLTKYLENTNDVCLEQFNLQSHLVQAPTAPVHSPTSGGASVGGAGSTGATGVPSSPSAAGGVGVGVGVGAGLGSTGIDGTGVSSASDILASFPADMPSLGEYWCSSKPTLLTETNSEFTVALVKHIFPQHVLLEFRVTNNVPDSTLKEVTPVCDIPQWSQYFVIPEMAIPADSTTSVYIAYQRDNNIFTVGPCPATLNFILSTDADDDEEAYSLEPVSVTESDYVKPVPSVQLCSIGQFKQYWEEIGAATEVVKKFSVPAKNLQSTVDVVLKKLNLQACDGNVVVPDGAKSFGMYLQGLFYGNIPVYCRAGFLWDAKDNTIGTVSFKIAVRCTQPVVAQMIANCIR